MSGQSVLLNGLHADESNDILDQITKHRLWCPLAMFWSHFSKHIITTQRGT